MARKKAEDSKKKTNLKVVTDNDGEVTPAYVVNEEDDKLRVKLKEIRANISQFFVDVAKGLYAVFSNGLYKPWGYEKFDDYVTEELDFQPRTARYFVNIWAAFGEPGVGAVKSDAMQKIQQIGWSKAKELIGVVDEKGANFDEWIEKASSMSCKALSEEAKVALDKSSPADSKGDDNDKPTAKPMAFKLFEEQFENVKRALAEAQKESKSKKPGHNLDLICTTFLSLNESGRDATALLSKIEKASGITIMAIDEKRGKVVYGQEAFKRLSEEDKAA